MGSNKNAASQKEVAIYMKVPNTEKAYMKSPSSKPAISFIIKKPENKSFIFTRYFTKFSMFLLYI